MSKAIKEIAKVVPAFAPKVLVDVGANFGRSTRDLAEAASGGTVFAFEPISKSFEQMRETLATFDNVVGEQVCLGSVEGNVLMTSRGTANSNRVVADGEARGSTEVVRMIRGDGYFRGRGVETIDLFKTSTNGWDLDVLVGMIDYIANRRIFAIEAVCALAPDDFRACPLDRMMSFLAPFGYGVLGFISPVRTMPDGTSQSNIALVDVIFVAE